MKISDKLKEILVNAYSDNNNDSISLGYNYSGRYMFGDTCIGFMINGISAFSAIAEITKEIESYEDKLVSTEFNIMLKSARIDDMGKGQIIYFPHYTI